MRLVAIQLAIGDDVLASAAVYRAHLERAADAIVPSGEPTLVVFPELAGHLALYALAPAGARRAKTLAAALAQSAVRRPLAVLRGAAATRRLDARHAVIAALAPDAEQFWKSVFAPLARRLGAYVVAGSHLRLAPSGELTNASLLYSPDGRLVATTDKANLVPGFEDAAPGGLALARGAPDVPIVDTALGRACTLIGYDACPGPRTEHERFVPVAAGVAARGGVDVVANPSANADGLPDTLAVHAFARFGVAAQLVGRVLDLAFDGASAILERTGAGVRRVAAVGARDRAGHAVAVVG